MEEDRKSESKSTGASPEKGWNDKEIEKKSAVGKEIGREAMLKEIAYDRPVGAAGEPGSHRFSVEPVGIELGETTIEIDHSDLKAEKVKRPGRSAVIF